jgi:uncharacterized protein (DUF2336 family)
MRRLLAQHPFSAAGLTGLAAFAVLIAANLDLDTLAGAAVLALFRTLGASFHLAANLLAQHLPNLPGWLDAALVVLLGALPYPLADAAWRRLRRTRWRPLSAPPPAPPQSTR